MPGFHWPLEKNTFPKDETRAFATKRPKMEDLKAEAQRLGIGVKEWAEALYKKILKANPSFKLQGTKALAQAPPLVEDKHIGAERPAFSVQEILRAVQRGLYESSLNLGRIAGEAPKDDQEGVEAIFEKIHKDNPQLPYKSRPKELGDITTCIFAFKDREQEIDQLAAGVCMNFTAYCRESFFKKDWNLFTITGGSGVGKTRLALESLGLVRKEIEANELKYTALIEQNLRGSTLSPKSVYNTLLESLQEGRAFVSYLDLGNGDWVDQWKQEDRILAALLCSVASKVFFPRTRVGSVVAQIPSSGWASIRVDTVAKSLRKHYGVGDQETLTIFLNLDEFQKRVTPEDLAAAQTGVGKEKILLRKMCAAIMDVVSQLAAWRVHLIPIFSGTLSMAHLRVFPATDYSTVNVTVGPLQHKSSVEIINTTLRDCTLPESLIRAMGGIPRALEYLEKVAHWAPMASPKELFESTRKLISDKYQVLAASDLRSRIGRLLQLCFSGQEVSKEENICGIPLWQLEIEGTVFLKPSNSNADRFRVVFPLVFAAAYNRGLGIFDDRFVTYRPMVESQGLEQFSRDFLLLKNNFFVEEGISKTTVGELFAGGRMSDALKKKEISLTPMSAWQAKGEQLPESGTMIEIQDKSGAIVDLATQCACVAIGRNCTSCDTIVSYPQPHRRSIVCLVENKSTMIFAEVENARVTLPTIQGEKNRALKAARKMFPDTEKADIIFLFVSNTPLPSTKLKQLDELLGDDSIVVSREHFEDFFSPTFAPIAIGDEGLHLPHQKHQQNDQP